MFVKGKYIWLMRTVVKERKVSILIFVAGIGIVLVAFIFGMLTSDPEPTIFTPLPTFEEMSLEAVVYYVAGLFGLAAVVFAGVAGG